mgnify:CR=1 FL=1
MKRFFSYLKPYWLPLSVSAFLIILVSLLVGIAPYIEGLIITSISNSLDTALPIEYRYIIIIILVLASIYIIVAASRFVFNWLLTRVIQKAVRNLRADIQTKIHKLPVSYFDNTLVGDTMGRMTTYVEAVSNGVQQSFATIISSVSLVIFIVIMMYWMNITLALIASVVIPLSFIITLIILKKSQPIFTKRYEEYGKITGYIQEKYTGYKEVILYNQQENLKKEFAKKNDSLAELVFRSTFLSGLLMPLLYVVTYFIIVVVVLVGSKLTIENVITLGVFQSFVRYVWRIANPISNLTQMSSIIQSSSAAAKRIFTFLDETEEIADEKSPLSLSHVVGEVKFDHVSFGYRPNKLILKDISFTAKPGQMVAIVGPTGSGKTTLINLLMRFYDVNQGTISIDQVPINRMKKDELREIFGMVLQDTWLFKGTIHENIKYSNENTLDSDVELAAQEANVDYFIKTQPQGYQTLINEESDNISQGEKQLLTIARAILANPNILILDEATSTVDTRIEFMLQEAMKRLLHNRTSFVIAHRLSTIINADVILVLKDGEIIEQGTHQELLALNGFYYKLFMSQFEGM